MIAKLWSFFLQSWRSLTQRRQVFSTVAIVLMLGFEIGTATLIFSVVDRLLIRELPFPSAGEIFSVELTSGGHESRSLFGRTANVSLYEAWRKQAAGLIDLAGFQTSAVTLTGTRPALGVQAVGVTWNAITLLGIKPQRGRVFVSSDDTRGALPSVVISYPIWRQLFGADAAAIERPLAINDRGFRIIGIMPQGFHIPLSINESRQDEPEVWVPLSSFRELVSQSVDASMPVEVIGRIPPEQSVAKVEARLSNVAKEVLPGASTAQVNRLRDVVVRDVRTTLMLISGAVILLVFLTYLNVANLLMARALRLEQDLAIKIALGASRSILVMQMIVDCAVISLAGGMLGLWLAFSCLPPLVRLGASYLPDFHAITVDGRVAAFSIALSCLSGIIVSTWPGMTTLSRSPINLIRSRQVGGSRTAGRWMRVLNQIEIAMAIVLLTAMGLLGRSFGRLTKLPRGYDSRGLIVGSLMLPQGRYPTDAARRAFLLRLLDGMERHPAITFPAVSSGVPILGGTVGTISSPEGGAWGKGLPASIWSASGHYFRSLGVPTLHGREMDFKDSEAVAVDVEAARLLFGNEFAVGRRITWADGSRNGLVQAVVANIQELSAGGASNTRNRTARPHLYVTALGSFSPVVRISARATGDSRRVIAGIRDSVALIDPTLTVSTLSTMDELVRTQSARERFLIAIVGLFAACAISLAGTGILSVMAYSTTQRTHEMGVRMALGATPKDIVLLILNEAMRTSVIGALIGILGSLAFGRVLSSILFETSPFEPLTTLAVVAFTVSVALFAAAIPAVQAGRVNAAVTLLEM